MPVHAIVHYDTPNYFIRTFSEDQNRHVDIPFDGTFDEARAAAAELDAFLSLDKAYKSLAGSKAIVQTCGVKGCEQSH